MTSCKQFLDFLRHTGPIMSHVAHYKSGDPLWVMRLIMSSVTYYELCNTLWVMPLTESHATHYESCHSLRAIHYDNVLLTMSHTTHYESCNSLWQCVTQYDNVLLTVTICNSLWVVRLTMSRMTHYKLCDSLWVVQLTMSRNLQGGQEIQNRRYWDHILSEFKNKSLKLVVFILQVL